MLEYRARVVHLIKMKVLTYASYEEDFEQYPEDYDTITVNNYCQIELVRRTK